MAEKEYIERGIVLKAFTHRVSELTDEPIVIGMNEALSIAEEFVMSVPSANVAPVRHGHWISENFYTHCSACGKMAIYDKYGQEVESDYCPKCGTKMDGGD